MLVRASAVKSPTRALLRLASSIKELDSAEEILEETLKVGDAFCSRGRSMVAFRARSGRLRVLLCARLVERHCPCE